MVHVGRKELTDRLRCRVLLHRARLRTASDFRRVVGPRDRERDRLILKCALIVRHAHDKRFVMALASRQILVRSVVQRIGPLAVRVHRHRAIASERCALHRPGLRRAVVYIARAELTGGRQRGVFRDCAHKCGRRIGDYRAVVVAGHRDRQGRHGCRACEVGHRVGDLGRRALAKGERLKRRVRIEAVAAIGCDHECAAIAAGHALPNLAGGAVYRGDMQHVEMIAVSVIDQNVTGCGRGVLVGRGAVSVRKRPGVLQHDPIGLPVGGLQVK